MARPPSWGSDGSDLDTARLDLAPRIGWLLRVFRVSAGMTVRTMAQGLVDLGYWTSPSAGTISERETKGSRHGRTIDGYEAVLGLPVGLIRSVVDITCRTFAYAPVDRAPDLTLPDPLAAVDAAFDAVGRDDPSGSDWHRLARVLTSLRGGVVPTAVLAPYVERLLDELMRAVGPAYYLRYEALARLQDGAYGDLVARAARELVDAPGSEEMSNNAITLVSDRPTPQVLAWMLELLERDSWSIFKGASMGISNMRHVGGLSPADWGSVVGPFVDAHARTRDDQARQMLLTDLFKQLPADVRRLISPRLAVPLSPSHAPVSWERDPAGNAHWALCRQISARVTREHGIAEHDMLARLLFEALFDFRSAMMTSGWLISVTPFATTIHAELLRVLDDPPDEVSARGAASLLFTSATPSSDALMADWFGAQPPAERMRRVGFAEQYALPLPAEAITALHEDTPATRAIVRALGSAEQPEVKQLVEDPSVPGPLRALASWWVQHGGRVTD